MTRPGYAVAFKFDRIESDVQSLMCQQMNLIRINGFDVNGSVFEKFFPCKAGNYLFGGTRSCCFDYWELEQIPPDILVVPLLQKKVVFVVKIDEV